MSKLSEILREQGLFALIGKISQKLVEKFLYQRVDVLYMRLTEPDPLGETTIDIYTCDFAEYQRWAEDHPRLKGQEDVAKERFEKGGRCYIGRMKDGRLGHIIWTTHGRELFASYETGDKCRHDLGKEVGIVIDAFTPEYARGQGFYPQVMRKLLLDLVEAYGEVWLWVVTTNTPSVRGLLKSGMQPKFVMGRSKLFGFIERCHFDNSPQVAERFDLAKLPRR